MSVLLTSRLTRKRLFSGRAGISVRMSPCSPQSVAPLTALLRRMVGSFSAILKGEESVCAVLEEGGGCGRGCKWMVTLERPLPGRRCLREDNRKSAHVHQLCATISGGHQPSRQRISSPGTTAIINWQATSSATTVITTHTFLLNARLCQRLSLARPCPRRQTVSRVFDTVVFRPLKQTLYQLRRPHHPPRPCGFTVFAPRNTIQARS